jgi:hypothetical protein
MFLESIPKNGSGSATMLESRVVTEPDGSVEIRCNSGDYAAISTGRRAASDPAKQASLRKVTAAAIRWARHEQRYGLMASDFKPGEAMLKMPALTAQFVKTIGARKALLNAVAALAD